MKLFTAPISPNGKRVRICAAELKLPLELVNLDFSKGEQRAPDYLARNPMGKVPTLVDGALTLWESGAILHHLATKGGGSPLWPTDANAQADVMRWMFFGACHLDPHYTTLVVERFIKARRNEPEDAALTRYAEQNLQRFIPVVEQQLAGREYVSGRFSIADIAIGCTLELSPLLRVDLAPHPSVRGWLERLRTRESWRTA